MTEALYCSFCGTGTADVFLAGLLSAGICKPCLLLAARHLYPDSSELIIGVSDNASPMVPMAPMAPAVDVAAVIEKARKPCIGCYCGVLHKKTLACQEFTTYGK